MENSRGVARKGYTLECYVVCHQLFIYHGLLELELQEIYWQSNGEMSISYKDEQRLVRGYR